MSLLPWKQLFSEGVIGHINTKGAGTSPTLCAQKSFGDLYKQVTHALVTCNLVSQGNWNSSFLPTMLRDLAFSHSIPRKQWRGGTGVLQSLIFTLSCSNWGKKLSAFLPAFVDKSYLLLYFYGYINFVRIMLELNVLQNFLGISLELF